MKVFEEAFEKVLKEKAYEAGFVKAAVLPTEELVFVPEYRKYCEQNLCGNYNRNYSCPPYCGTVEEMKEKACHYQYALVLQTQVEARDIYDGEETKLYKKEHTKKTKALMEQLRTQGLIEKGRVIMAGPCNLCAVCGMPKGVPCPHGEEQFSCLSAYCIDAGELAKNASMEIAWTGNRVYFFSLYLFGE